MNYISKIVSKKEYNFELIRSYCKYPDNGCCTHPDSITKEFSLSVCSWLNGELKMLESATIKALNEEREFIEAYHISVLTWKWMLESMGLWEYKYV